MQEGRFYGGLSEFELAERCSVAQQSCDVPKNINQLIESDLAVVHGPIIYLYDIHLRYLQSIP